MASSGGESTLIVVLALWVLFSGNIKASSLTTISDDSNAINKCPSGLNDLGWFRHNARTLLFMEHLQSRAAKENLFGWSDQLGTESFRSQLRAVEQQFLGADEIPEECLDRMPIQPNIAQRIHYLEDRLENCNSNNQQIPCALGGGAAVTENSYAVTRRMSALQAELMRQRAILRQLHLRLVNINRQSEGI